MSLTTRVATVPINNSGCDVYRNGNAPPAAADVTNAQGNLRCVYPQGYEPGEGGTATQFTHIFDTKITSDIRDGGATPGVAGGDTLYFPDKDGGLIFTVVFVANMVGLRRCWLRRTNRAQACAEEGPMTARGRSRGR